MSSTNRLQPTSRGLIQVIVGSVGMTLVAFICALSGLFYGSKTIPTWANIWFVVAYGFLVFPYFLGREATIEGPIAPKHERNDKGLTIPGAFFILISLVAASILWINFDHNRLLGTTAVFCTDSLWLPGLSALFPFIYLWLRTQLRLRIDDTALAERRFRNKVVLPALATCLVSFSFGWALTNGQVGILCVVITGAVIVSMKEWTIKKDIELIWLASLVSLAIIGAFVSWWVSQSEVGKVIIIGTILTYAMGVAEVCKRVVHYRPIGNTKDGVGERDGYDPSEPYLFYLTGANWASILFPLLLCFLPLLIPELPVWPIFVLLSFQYIHWHHIFLNKNNEWLFWLNVGLGYSLPLAICLQYWIQLPPVVFHKEALSDLISYIGIPVGITLTISTFLQRDKVESFLQGLNKTETFKNPDHCFWLFILVVYGVFVLVGLFAILADAGLGISSIRIKATEIICYLFILLLLVIALYLYNKTNPMSGKELSSDENNLRQRPKRGLRLHKYTVATILIWQIGRLPISLVAGSVVLLTAAFRSGLPWWLIILHTIPMVLVTMMGFTVNDIYDVEKDKYARRQKPIAQGLVTTRQAAYFALFLAGATLVVSALIEVNHSYAVIAATIVGVLGYSAAAQKFPLAKGLYTAMLCCAPFAYAVQITGVNFPIWFYLVLITFILGREILLDVVDFQGDQQAGMHTIVAYLRPRLSRAAGWGLMTGTIIYVSLNANGIALLFCIATLVSLALSAVISARNESLGIGWTRLTLLLGVTALTLTT